MGRNCLHRLNFNSAKLRVFGSTPWYDAVKGSISIVSWRVQYMKRAEKTWCIRYIGISSWIDAFRTELAHCLPYSWSYWKMHRKNLNLRIWEVDSHKNWIFILTSFQSMGGVRWNIALPSEEPRSVLFAVLDAEAFEVRNHGFVGFLGKHRYTMICLGLSPLPVTVTVAHEGWKNGMPY